MDIGLTNMGLDSRFTDKETVGFWQNAGIRYMDYYFSRYLLSSPHLKESESEANDYFLSLKEYANGRGVFFDQTHAPYPTFAENAEDNAHICAGVLKSIHAAAMLGARVIVVHPQMPYRYHYDSCRAVRKPMNIRFYQSLLPYLEKYNIHLAIENMFCRRRRDKTLIANVCSTAEEMIDFQDTIHHPLITLCMDIGHANIIHKDGGTGMLDALQNRIGVMHIHDNNGFQDEHLFPGDGTIPWETVLPKIKKLPLNGILNLECHGAVLKNLPGGLDQNLQTIAARAIDLCKNF